MARSSIAKLKQLPEWVVLVLGIITLGVYSCVWISRRYREATPSPSKWSHWSIPISAPVLAVIAVFTLSASAVAIENAGTAATIVTYSSYGIFLLAGIGITWWAVHYAAGINKMIATTVPTAAVVIMAFFFAPILTTYQQHLINTKRDRTVSRVPLSAAVAISAALGIALILVGFITTPIDTQIESLKVEYTKAHQEIQRIKQLSSEYQACIDKLNEDYPQATLTNENYDSYKAGYDHCDEIYKKI